MARTKSEGDRRDLSGALPPEARLNILLGKIDEHEENEAALRRGYEQKIAELLEDLEEKVSSLATHKQLLFDEIETIAVEYVETLTRSWRRRVVRLKRGVLRWAWGRWGVVLEKPEEELIRRFKRSRRLSRYIRREVRITERLNRTLLVRDIRRAELKAPGVAVVQREEFIVEPRGRFCAHLPPKERAKRQWRKVLKTRTSSEKKLS